MKNMKNGFEDWGVLCAIYKLVLFELNRVTTILFELKTEEMGGKGGIMWSFVICTAACQILGYQRTVANG